MTDLHRRLQQLYEHYKSGASLNAEIGIREALETWPDNTDVLRLGALTALAINQTVTAHQRIDRAIALTPMTAEMANIQGRILKASGDWAAAEDAYLLALQLDPKFEQARNNLLNLFTISEQPIRVLETLENYDNFGPIGDIAKAQALTDLGRYDEALNVLNRIDDSSLEDRVLFQRLKCLSISGQLDEAHMVFAEFPKDSTFYPQALSIIVNSFEMRNQPDASLIQVENLAQSSNPSVGLQAIALLRRLDRSNTAKSLLEDLLKNYPDNIEVLCEAANTARMDGRADESCEVYKQALTLRPGHYGALSGFAGAAIVAGRSAEAQTALQAALNQAPNNQYLLALVATLLRQTGGPHKHLYNYENYVRIYDLMPPKGYETIQDFNVALKEKLNGLHVYQNAPVNQSLRLGTQTERDLSLIDDPVLRGFFDAIDAPIRDYLGNIGHDAAHPLSRRNRGPYRVQGAWSVRLKGGGHHVNHVHPMGWISSAYYVDLPKNISDTNREGWIKFGETNLDIDQPAEHYVQPKPGRLVLFPSYMWHGTVPFTGSETRLTLPFDVVPA